MVLWNDILHSVIRFFSLTFHSSETRTDEFKSLFKTHQFKLCFNNIFISLFFKVIWVSKRCSLKVKISHILSEVKDPLKDMSGLTESLGVGHIFV